MSPGPPPTAEPAQLDLDDRASIRRAVRKAVACHGGIDVLVNTVAIYTTRGLRPPRRT